ncbi:MAG TPA: PAS domain-containing protein [Fimbriiglobus sp.]|jgi:PAS domain S-box-containing protein|nr:PAS domain-containing protein [Fimbriiglobus sp.]
MGVILQLTDADSRFRRYSAAILTVLAAMLVLAALDPLEEGSQGIVLPLLGVVYVAWRHGLGPALVTLVLSAAATVYLFLEPRYTLAVSELGDRLALMLFLLTGLCCALLGEAQRRSRRRSEQHAARLRADQDALAERSRLSALRADVSARLAGNEPLREVLQGCAETLVRGLDAAFARVWTLDDAHEVLELQASAGLYTHRNGAHSRVKVGEYKIGRIARDRRPHLTNDVPNDPNVSNPDWARREGMVAFAGYPLLVEDRTVGVLAVFARHPLSPVVLADLAPLADAIAQCVERKRADEAQRASEARFRQLADAMPQIVWVAQPDGSHEYHNRQRYEYTGLTPEESLGRGWSLPLHPDDRPRAEDQWRQATDTGEPYETEYRIRGRDVDYRWFLSRALPVRDESGAIVRWYGTCTDIDEFKLLREQLQAGEERYRFLAETLPALVWSSRADGTPDYNNGRWYEYTGLSRDPGQDPAEGIIHPDDQPRTAERWQRALETGTRYQNELRLRRADGAYHWFLAQALPMRGPDGAVARWFGSAVDIDDQKRLQLELTQSMERYRLLTEAIPQVVWNANADGRVTYVNTRWLDFTGLTIETSRDRGWITAVHPDDAGRVADAWQQTVRTVADRFAHEFRLRQASDGSYRWFLAVAVPLRRPDRTVDQWIGSMADIHDQKEHARTLERMVSERTAELLQQVEDRRKAEEQARSTAVELARSNEELEKFAYVASHDLQEPLRKIQAFGDRLRAKYRDGLGDQGRDYLDRVLNSAGRMRRLIEDLLALSRVTTKGQPFAPVDLAAVAEGVLSDLEERIEETGAAVTVGPMPTIEADATQMRQLLQNLVGNALKFHRPGVPPAVSVQAEVVPDADGAADRPVCRITVTDNGIGFDVKYLDRIFQVFQRLHGRGEYEGTGVGLAICRKIVERHGGTITARSTPGAGTTFVVAVSTRQPDGQP